MNKMINCYICGSWVKPNKQGIYVCPKCKAMFEKAINEKGNEEIVRLTGGLVNEI